MTATKLTPKQLLARMRALMAVQLKYNLNSLSPSEAVRLDRAATLRLLLDDLQSKQLAGLDFDAKAFVEASEDLERLVGGDPATQQPHFDFSGAKDELLRLLDQRAGALERRAERERAAIEAANNPPQQDQGGVAPTTEPPATANTEPLPANVLPIRGGIAAPPQPLPPSPTTTSFFSNIPGAGRSGSKRFDPPSDW